MDPPVLPVQPQQTEHSPVVDIKWPGGEVRGGRAERGEPRVQGRSSDEGSAKVSDGQMIQNVTVVMATEVREGGDVMVSGEVSYLDRCSHPSSEPWFSLEPAARPDPTRWSVLGWMGTLQLPVGNVVANRKWPIVAELTSTVD